jgi:uncharacterized protein YjeT (DUF2065 family)
MKVVVAYLGESPAKSSLTREGAESSALPARLPVEAKVSTKAVLAMTLVVEGIVPEGYAEKAAQRMIRRMRSAATELVNAGTLATALEAELASQHALVAASLPTS